MDKKITTLTKVIHELKLELEVWRSKSTGINAEIDDCTKKTTSAKAALSAAIAREDILKSSVSTSKDPVTVQSSREELKKVKAEADRAKNILVVEETLGSTLKVESQACQASIGKLEGEYKEYTTLLITTEIEYKKNNLAIVTLIPAAKAEIAPEDDRDDVPDVPADPSIPKPVKVLTPEPVLTKTPAPAPQVSPVPKGAKPTSTPVGSAKPTGKEDEKKPTDGAAKPTDDKKPKDGAAKPTDEKKDDKTTTKPTDAKKDDKKPDDKKTDDKKADETKPDAKKPDGTKPSEPEDKADKKGEEPGLTPEEKSIEVEAAVIISKTDALRKEIEESEAIMEKAAKKTASSTAQLLAKSKEEAEQTKMESENIERVRERQKCAVLFP